MADLIVIAVVALCVGCAVRYIIKAKKSGVKCIGCPAAGTGSGHHGHQGPHGYQGGPAEPSGCSCGCGSAGEKPSGCACGCGSEK